MEDPLSGLRQEQDQIDREIIAAIAKRYAIRKKISAFRIENGLTTVDPARMQYVLAQAKQFAKEEGLPEEMAEEIFHVLIDWSHRLDPRLAKREGMNIANTLKSKPWLPFLALALVMQQANLLTYKLGGQFATAQLFLTYSFFVQCLVNLGLVAFFKSRGFPVVLQGKMRWWVGFVALIYFVNEMTLMTVYQIGAPYSLMMTVYSLSVMIIMTCVGIFFIKEKISPKQIIGIFLAMVSIALVRLG